ncbi:MAG TPA: hypothetical protein VEX65_07775 [Flavisolibacter sp.]|nr:hypothetical protein [Flavisolibacter sp.]
MLEKLFSWTKKKEGEEEVVQEESVIRFGRYSDNNKSVAKVERWNEAENFFKEKKYKESILAFFDYLRDEEEDNVKLVEEGGQHKFLLYQGSKIIRGYFNTEKLEAEVMLAHMPQPSVPVMRRLLEMNFNLYYTRYALYQDKVYMFFDSDIDTCNPSKLYYGLKELATKADKQDDLLVQDFTTLLPIDTEHTNQVPDEEKEVKHRFFKKWIADTLELIGTIDNDKYSGGIAYLLLALAYRIDYFIVPEGRLLSELEKIVEIYFRKDNRLVTEKNQEMMECFQRLASKDKAAFYPYLFRSKFTFSIVTPQNYKTVADAIYNANQNIAWYKEHKMPKVAAQISEYGFSYCQYSYSLPRPVSELFHLFMMINYADYFKALGVKDVLYEEEKETYDKEKIAATINSIVERWKEKYPELKFDTGKLKYENPVAFNQTFTTEVEYLNLETR